MSAQKDYYDWLVIGDHPGALLSGALMAKRGFSVLLLLDNPSRPGSQAIRLRNGESLDPEPNAIAGLSPGSLLRECLEVLETDLPLAESSSDGLQLVTPSLRVPLSGELSELDAALQRETGQKGFKLSGILQTLQTPLHQFWKAFTDYTVPVRSGRMDRRPKTGRTVMLARDTVARHRSAMKPLATSFGAVSAAVHDEWRQGVLAAALGSVREQRPDEAEWVSELWMSRTNAAVKGGLSWYREILIRTGERYGVHVAARESCKRLFVEKRRLIGLQWAERGKMIGLGGGAIGCELESLEPLFDGSKRRFRASPHPLGWRITVGLRVRSEGLPPGVLRRNIFKQPGAPWIEMELADPAESPEGFRRGAEPETLLFLRTVLPWTDESLRPEIQRRVCARMFAQVKHLLPFLEYHVVSAFPDLSLADTGLASYREAYGYRTLEQIPESLRIYGDHGMGVFSGIDGLYVVNNQAFPEFGAWAGGFGGTVAALESLAWFSEERRRVGDMRYGRDTGRFFGFLQSPPRK